MKKSKQWWKMKRLTTYIGALGTMSVRHTIGRGAVIALSILLLPFLFVQVSTQANLQRENSAWANYARQFSAQNTQVQNQKVTAIKPFDISNLQTFTPAHIQKAVDEARELNCLTTAIYYEARSESVAGQLAVAQVILNRASSKHYPSSVCAVVYQGSTRKTGCQFSFTCDGSLDVLPRNRTWDRSRKSALSAMLGMRDVTIGNATHYHTAAIRPVWSSHLLRTANVGSHIFYRFPNAREKALLAKDI